MVQAPSRQRETSVIAMPKCMDLDAFDNPYPPNYVVTTSSPEPDSSRDSEEHAVNEKHQI